MPSVPPQLSTGLVTVALALACVGVFYGVRTSQELTLLRTDLASTTAALNDTQMQFAAQVNQVHSNIVTAADELYNVEKRINALESGYKDVAQSVGDLTGSVKTLTKISTTDSQLLEKYSKVYFLNENYMPASLKQVDAQYVYPQGDKKVNVLTDMYPFLKEMLQAAARKDIDILVLSGYRSFKEQATLKEGYVMTYGSGANQFSAEQGYSEHQLGTAIDFTTSVNGGNLDAFDPSDALTWLESNAYKYGFIMSYPKGNTYYEYEPWHWRFVGIKLATYLHQKHENFYDLEQREIDGYLANLWDD